MDHDQLLFDLKQAPSLRLLRSPNAALILSFLHRTFKRDQRISIPLAELVQWLDTYLELLNEQQSGLYPLATSHSFTAQSKPPLASRRPSGEKASLLTGLVCPARVCTQAPLAALIESRRVPFQEEANIQ